MKHFSKIILVIIVVISLFSLSSCSDLKITDEMQVAIDEYIAAIKKSQTRIDGEVFVSSIADDQAIEFKTTKSTIDCSYSSKDGKVTFERTDTLDGRENAKYSCDGTIVNSYNYETEAWEDKTSENKDFLSVDTNPFITMTLFRVDSKYKIDTGHLSNILSYTEDEFRVVEFVLKNSSISEVMSYNKADGIVRESTGNSRKYYIDKDGYIAKIEITTVQTMRSNGKEGTYTTEMIVLYK